MFGNPIPTIHWTSVAATTSVTFKIDHRKSERDSFLHVSNITWEDRGKVACFGESILGKVNKSGSLVVQGKSICFYSRTSTHAVFTITLWS